jgi:energy-coupling factor transport system substrate-specific component
MKDTSKRSFKEIVLFKVNGSRIITILFAILINVAGHFLSSLIGLPLWLDNVGTMIVAIPLGPLASIIVGGFSHLILWLPERVPIAYLLVSISVGIVIGFFFPKKHREDIFAIVTAGVLCALVSTLISFPLNLYYYNGLTGNSWGDALFKMLSQTVSSKGVNAFLSEAFIDFPDRVLSVFIALFFVDLEETRIFKKKNRSITRTLTLLLTFILAGSFLTVSFPKVRAYDNDSDFEVVTYGTEDGLLTNEINTVNQTPDGYIWIGTYSGLYRYNGVKFSPVMLDERIRNIVELFVDSEGKLWIGTNDSGAFSYDPATGDVLSYNMQSGLEADSVRTICEDKEGNIYLGTVRSLARISADGTVKNYSDQKDLYYTISLTCMADGSLLGVTNSGIFFRMKDGKVLSAETYEADNISYRSVACSWEEILVATTGHDIARYSADGDSLIRKNTITISEHNYINYIEYSAINNAFFFCSKNGFGYIDKGTYTASEMADSDFNGAVSDLCIDAQGNIWFASNTHGLMKCSRTPFRNLFHRAGIAGGVVNAVLESDGLLYVGMDTGLQVIDLATEKLADLPWLSNVGHDRIRNIMVDSKGNIWLSTYGVGGLLRIDKDGNIHSISEKNGGVLGGEMRSAIELSDGRILVASNRGLSYIEDDQVVGTIGEKDGLKNQFILTMYEKEDGTILAGSDGDGIYIIKDGHVSGNIGSRQGLLTSVVMRIVKGTSGFFYVTSNALYYDDGQSIRALKNFPYSNNYDIIITKNGTCWIPSSAGLFMLDEEELIGDGDYTYTLLNRNWGLNTSFTANSWNLIMDGTIYLCCTDGVRALQTDQYSKKNTNYQIHLESIVTADEVIYEKDGKYVIPPSSGRISFNIGISNYTLTDPLIHYYLKGAEDEGITCYQNEILPLEYTNLSAGKYELHVEVINESNGYIENEGIFKIEKKAMMHETLYFRIYLLFVLALFMFYIAWLFLTINRRAKKIRGLQMEMSTDPMTGLYNKAASEKVLTKICSDESGILMMIDLDSFKLVNDLYGHDMGDKILIRFAELITEAVGEGNMGGRLGGDEFIGFIKNTSSEEDVERITKFLNREIVKSAKEFMGDDMNIPLGASVGAVRIPAEGRDFSKLFRYADKALYIVKQNGKHGYSFFQKRGDTGDQEAANSEKNNLTQIKKIIGERNEGKGAFSVNFDKLQVIYKFLNRNNKVTGNLSSIVKFTLETEDGSEVSDEIKDAFEDMLITNLKKNDIVNRYAGCFFTIFTDCDPKNYEAIINRLKEKWNEEEGHSKYHVKAEVEGLE